MVCQMREGCFAAAELLDFFQFCWMILLTDLAYMFYSMHVRYIYSDSADQARGLVEERKPCYALRSHSCSRARALERLPVSSVVQRRHELARSQSFPCRCAARRTSPSPSRQAGGAR